MKNKLILTLALSSLACTFFACDDDEPDPTPTRPTAQCSVSKCEGMSVYLCKDGQYVFSENCKTKCEAGKCVDNTTPTTPTTCSNGQKRCNGNIPQTCNANGQWVSGDTCLAGQNCVDGVCTGTPTEQPVDPNKCTAPKCEGNVSYACQNGQYVQNEVCDYKCEDGVCVDEPVVETPCTGRADGCYCSGALAGANSFCCKDEAVTGEQQCKDSTPFCMADGDAPKCVGCRNSEDCDASTPVCNANVCEAKNAEWCNGKADGYYCRTEDGVDTGFGCEGGKVLNEGWFLPTACTEGNARVCRAGAQGFECVECLGDNDCPDGKVCKTDEYVCVVPGDDKNSCPNVSFVGLTCYSDPNYYEYVVDCDLGNEKSRQKCADSANGKVCIKDGDYAFCGCKKDADCNGFKCDNQACKSVCKTDTDCAKDYNCVNQKCVKPEAGCTKDSDCKSGFECKNKVCVEKASTPECTRDSDCLSGYECKNQVCVEKTPAGGSKTYKETFADKDDASSGALSYKTEDLVSTITGIKWSVNVGSWGHTNSSVDYSIDKGGVLFKDATGYVEATMADGIASISVDVKSALTTETGRKVEMYIDASSEPCATAEFLGDKGKELHVLKCDVNKSGSVKIKIANKAKHTIIDNITWTNKQ